MTIHRFLFMVLIFISLKIYPYYLSCPQSVANLIV